MSRDDPSASPPSAPSTPALAPVGIDRLLRLAAVDASFRDALLERRSAVARYASVELTPTEAAILDSVPAAQLEMMAAQVPPQPLERRGFLKGVAAAAVVLLGGATASAAPGDWGDDRPGRAKERGSASGGGATVELPPPRPLEVELAELSIISGPRDEGSLRPPLRRALARLRTSCRRELSAVQEGQRIALSFRVAIRPDGAVRSVTPHRTPPGAEALAGCVRSTLHRVRLPAADELCLIDLVVALTPGRPRPDRL
jgi:hypothetical protein